MGDPGTHVVDASGGGDFTTVTRAIGAASPGDRILVRPGLYRESLIMDKPLEIIGDGPRSGIEIWGDPDAAVLDCTAATGRVAGLLLRQTAGKPPPGVYYTQLTIGVNISGGRLEVEGCDIWSDADCCVYIHGGSEPVLRRNSIHDARRFCVYVYERSGGILEDNLIFGARHDCVVVADWSTPVLRRNEIRDSRSNGVLVHSNGGGTFEENAITGNALAGMQVDASASPTVRGNRITGNHWHGVKVRKGGGGVFEDNDLTGNGHGAWHFDSKRHHSVTQARNTE